MTTVITRGAGSAQALGYAARATAANYIEDVFSTYLYTGNGSTQTITNGIDLSTKGGLVWMKQRSGAVGHALYDTSRGVGFELASNSTTASSSVPQGVTSFNTTGFSLGTDSRVNQSSRTLVSWTFRKQAKFFDVVTYTGNGSDGRSISHSLGGTVGWIILKRTDTSTNWMCWHRGINGGNGSVNLNLTAAASIPDNGDIWGVRSTATYVAPTSSTFTVSDLLNANGGTYVAYLFAHDAGGFGASGADNVISCGSTGGGSSEITLGYEPQFLLYRVYDTTDDWHIIDNMRGASVGSPTYNTWSNLNANTSGAETSVTGSAGNPNIKFTATGFVLGAIPGNAIYIAIRRGPMRTPTSGTSVFRPTYLYQYDINGNASSGNGIHGYLGNVSDAYIQLYLSGSALNAIARTRLTGVSYLVTSSTAAEVSATTPNFWDNNVASGLVTANSVNNTISTLNLRRAPGFFDEVCYTGTGSARTVTHNLAAVPELLIVKRRDTVEDWNVYSATTGNAAYLRLNTTAAVGTAGADALWGSTTPTSSVFTVKTSGGTNASGGTYVAYLFASCPGVSKVGSYTGTGTTQTINCGFTAGARFVLIKRTDSTGDWYVWDSARGIVAGNDPHLSLNTTAAEVTTDDSVDTDSTGFVVNQVAATNINVTSASYIFLAVS